MEGAIPALLAPWLSTDVPRRPRTNRRSPEATAPGPELLLARLEAGQLAIRSGLPLSTAEVAWIMGAAKNGPIPASPGMRQIPWSFTAVRGHTSPDVRG